MAESLVKAYVDWAAGQEVTGATVTVDADNNRVTYSSEGAVGTLEVYELEMDVVAMTVTDPSGEDSKFFLHFELDDLARAQEMFSSFAEAIASAAGEGNLRVLLSCTSALTTSFFAKKLQEASELMGYPMEFRAVPFARIYEEGSADDAILLAPQVAYHEREVAQAFPNKFVAAVPPEHFASYDVGVVIDFLRDEQRKWREKRAAREALEAREQVRNQARVLVVGVFPEGHVMRFVTRIYQGGEVKGEEVSILGRSGKMYAAIPAILRDIVVTTQVRFGACDIVGVALPGIVKDGEWELSRRGVIAKGNLQEKLECGSTARAVISNNVNAAAFGYAYKHGCTKNFVFISHAAGSQVGGMGIVMGGQLIQGAHGGAGELRYVATQAVTAGGHKRAEYYEPDYMLGIASHDVRVGIAAYDPPVMCVRSPLTPDMDALADRVGEIVPRDVQPELRFVTEDEMTEYTMLGQMLLSLDEYERSQDLS